MVFIVFAMPRSLRTAPTKSVRFDNSDGMVRTTQGRLVRRPPSPSPEPSPEPEPESEPEQQDEDEPSTESEPEAIAPITTELELRWVFENMKTGQNSTIVRMASWAPGNELREDYYFTVELNDLKRQVSNFYSTYIDDRADEWSSYSLRGVNAQVSHRGSARNPYHFALDYLECESLKAIYSKVKQLHLDGARDIRVLITQHARLQAKTPPPVVESQSQTSVSTTKPRSSQKRPRSETATERQNRGREAARDAKRLTGNSTTVIWDE